MPNNSRDFARRLETEPIFFAENFLKKFFYLPFANFQRVAVKGLLLSRVMVNILFMPRGFGKSTLITCLLAIWFAIFKQAKHILLISQTAERAQSLLDDVKNVLELPEFVDVFGDMVGKWWGARRAHLFSEQFGVDCYFSVASIGSQLRGIKVNGVRPQYVFLDDAEDDEDVASPKQVDKTEMWVIKKLLPAIAVDESLGFRGFLYWLATTIAGDSAVQRISEREGSFVMNFPALITTQEMADLLESEVGESIWPEKISTETLRKLRDSLILEGKSTVWYNEYQNDPRSSEEIIFHEGNNRTFSENDIVDMEIPMFMAIDASGGGGRTSCNTGISTGGFNHLRDLYIWNCIERKMAPNVFLDTIVAELKYFIKIKRPVQAIGVESGYYDYIEKLMKERLWDKEGINVSIKQLKHENKTKPDRIRWLLPWHSSKRLYVNKHLTVFLSKLVRFPIVKDGIDGPDSAAYLTKMSYVPSKPDMLKRLPEDSTKRAIAMRFLQDKQKEKGARIGRGSIPRQGMSPHHSFRKNTPWK